MLIYKLSLNLFLNLWNMMNIPGKKSTWMQFQKHFELVLDEAGGMFDNS